MNVLELLTKLADDGFGVRLEGDTLYVNPASRLSPDIISEIKQHKPELVKLLAETPGFVPIVRFPPAGEDMVARYEIAQCKRSARRGTMI